MAASKLDIIIEQGVTWALTITLKKKNKLPMPLVGYSGYAQIRKAKDSPDIIVVFNVDVSDNGVVIISLPDEATSTLDFTAGYYDLKLFSPEGAAVRILEGKAVFSPEVTRDEGLSGYSGYSGYSGG